MEESHGKQDSCQEGQDHLGHVLEREDSNIASHAGGGRNMDKPFSPGVLSVILAQLHLPDETHTSGQHSQELCTKAAREPSSSSTCLVHGQETSTAPTASTAPGHSFRERAHRREF